MTTLRFVWPLLMVAALIAVAMILRYQAKKRALRRKGHRQHASMK